MEKQIFISKIILTLIFVRKQIPVRFNDKFESMVLRVFIIALVCSGVFSRSEIMSQDHKSGNAAWNQLLSKHVDNRGWVNYEGFLADRQILENYLDRLSQSVPDRNWSTPRQLTYWINAYNAFTIQLILDHYPVKSIRDIDQAWDVEFIRLGEEEYSLNQIEHEIIRKQFEEPRIHFALVCAAVSCPPLLNEAYSPEKLDEQLEQRSRSFINDPKKNAIEPKKIRVSQIFNWFKEDFTKNGALIDYLNRFSETKINADAEVVFMEYDWGLNGE
jgi:hypothetical protein